MGRLSSTTTAMWKLPVLRAILERITSDGRLYARRRIWGESRGIAIVSDELVRKAAVQEVIRRGFAIHANTPWE